jgi:hypothetical protein
MAFKRLLGQAERAERLRKQAGSMLADQDDRAAGNTILQGDGVALFSSQNSH